GAIDRTSGIQPPVSCQIVSIISNANRSIVFAKMYACKSFAWVNLTHTMARRTKGIGKNTILAPNVTKDLSRPHLSRHCQGHYPTKGGGVEMHRTRVHLGVGGTKGEEERRRGGEGSSEAGTVLRNWKAEGDKEKNRRDNAVAQV
ncbi:hypothetical protein ALC53_11969, partial [Atta colombica]